MTTSTKKRSIVVLAITAVLALAGGIAYAYFSSTGTGSGSATTGTSTAFTVASTPATGPALTPGGPAQTAAFSVTNPGSGVQNLASVVVTVANADGTPWTAVPGCSAADYTVTTPTITLGQIPAGGVVNGTVDISMVNAAGNQDACKLATVPLYFLAS